MRSRPKGRRSPKIVRHVLIDGTVKEYRYSRRIKPKAKAVDTIDALIEAYRRSPEWASLADRTRKSYTIYHRVLEKVGHLEVRSIKRRDLRTAIDQINTTRGPGAAKNFTRATAALFRWALDRDWIEYSPAAQIRLPKGGHLPAWTAQEADMAEQGLPEHLRRVVVLARYTGQRRGDLCAMTWTAFDGETIRVKQQKTGAQLVIPCHPTLRDALVKWKQDARAVTILENTAGRPWVVEHLSHELPIGLGRLGMREGLNVHGLRKLAAASLADAGCTIHEIAAVTGHATLAMVQHYTRTADQERLAGAAIIRLQERKKTKHGN